MMETCRQMTKICPKVTKPRTLNHNTNHLSKIKIKKKMEKKVKYRQLQTIYEITNLKNQFTHQPINLQIQKPFLKAQNYFSKGKHNKTYSVKLVLCSQSQLVQTFKVKYFTSKRDIISIWKQILSSTSCRILAQRTL